MQGDGEWHGENRNAPVEILRNRMSEPRRHVAVVGKTTRASVPEEAEARAMVRILAALVAVEAGKTRVEYDGRPDGHPYPGPDRVDVAVHLLPEHGGPLANPLTAAQDVEIGLTNARPTDGDADLTRLRRRHGVSTDVQAQVAREPQRSAHTVANRLGGLISLRCGPTHRRGAYPAATASTPTRR